VISGEIFGPRKKTVTWIDRWGPLVSKRKDSASSGIPGGPRAGFWFGPERFPRGLLYFFLPFLLFSFSVFFNLSYLLHYGFKLIQNLFVKISKIQLNILR
jgi:hypothetical protein